MPKLSIILVSYNTKQLTEDCLRSLNTYVDLKDIEIIVVDNNSVDGSAEMIRERFPAIILVENESNMGFSKGNNIGIRRSSGEYLLLLNTDTIIIEDFVSPIFEYLEKNKAVGVLGCRVLSKDRELKVTCWNQPNIFTELSFFTVEVIKNIYSPFAYWKNMQYWDHLSVREVDCVSGCFMWIRREVVEAVGGLDEDNFMYYEDTEFCRRVRKHSEYKVVFFPATSIIHLGGASGDGKEVDPKVIKFSYQSCCNYLEVAFGKSWQRLFKILCGLIWRVELCVFYLLKRFRPFAKKYNLIKWMLSKTEVKIV